MVKENRAISLMGEIFYDLRTQRNFKLADFEKVGLSKSSVSDFESGRSILRFDKLDAALELMHIEVSEFEYFFNNYHSDYFVEICDEKENLHYLKVKKYREKIVQIVCWAVVKYISENKFSIAQKLLEDVNIALIPYKKDLFCRNMSRFTLGLLLYQSGKTADGKAKMESSIRLFDELGLPEMKAYYQKNI